MKKSKPQCFISGIAPGDSGTGRFLSFVLENIPEDRRDEVVFIKGPPTIFELKNILFSRNRREISRVTREFFIGYGNLIFRLLPHVLSKESEITIFHPQNLGFRLTRIILGLMRGSKRLFLLDSSFFCIRSYNHLQGESRPCVRCLGGGFAEQEKARCLPFPFPSSYARRFLEYLLKIGRSGEIVFLAQGKQQQQLAKSHFGEGSSVIHAGVWTDEYDDCIETQLPHIGKYLGRPKLVFHGNYHPAKGADWLFELARLVPDVDFYFPFPELAPNKMPWSPNIHFKRMTWDSGLSEMISEADGVIVPSLWSAPIEGALVKSILVGKRTFVVDNKTAFMDDIPDSLIFRLVPDVREAAAQLKLAIQTDWRHSLEARSTWIGEFKANRKRIIDTLFNSY